MGEPMQAGLVQVGGRAHTPDNRRSTSKRFDTSSSPHLEPKSAASSTSVATPDVTHCPRPWRAFPGSPGGAGPPDFRSATDDNACDHEIQAMLGGGGAEAHLPNGKSSNRLSTEDGSRLTDNRPLSSVSTSAGPTPSPDGRSSPHFASPVAEPNGDHLSAGPSQTRKIFVGGIPQDMQQDELFKFFAEYGQVKKAWLQRYRDANAKAKTTAPGTNHRGFGFVIFQDGAVVERLLGNSPSLYINLKDGRRLEVKRAVSSSDMAATGDTNSSKAKPAKGSGRQKNSSTGHVKANNNAQPCPEPSGEGQQRANGLYGGALPGSWQADPRDPRVLWVNGQAASPVPQNSMVLTSQAHSPWPTSGGDMIIPQQSASSPQRIQQIFPAMTGVPIAAPTAVRVPAGGMIMPGQCAYTTAPLPHNGMSWVPAASQTPPPMHVPIVGSPVPVMPCSNGASQPQMQPVCNNAWTAQWAWQQPVQQQAMSPVPH